MISQPSKIIPIAATQHVTAGPYSPVLEVRPGRLLVLSGQGPLDSRGSLVGNTIEEQAHATLENCRRLLQNAGADLADVFRVTVYLADLAQWERFNAVYGRIMPQPYPARTAVGVDLLLGMRVEIDMWAVA